MTPKLRLSYSLLRLWMQGKSDDAINLYHHIKSGDGVVPEAIKQGKDIHREIEEYVKKNKKLPEWISPIELHDPMPEQYIKVEYNELFDLSARIDLLDSPSFFEFKTGMTDVMSYVSAGQTDFYFLICSLSGILVDRAYLIHHNQYYRQNELLLVWDNDTAKERARNMIDTVGPEIYQFFTEQGVL